MLKYFGTALTGKNLSNEEQFEFRKFLLPLNSETFVFISAA
jgi:hypothetical protein